MSSLIPWAEKLNEIESLRLSLESVQKRLCEMAGISELHPTRGQHDEIMSELQKIRDATEYMQWAMCGTPKREY